MTEFLKVLVFGGLFAVPFLTIYVENDYFFPYITGKNFWFRIIVDVAFVAWVVLALADARFRPKFSWLLGGFSALLVVMFFANLLGVHPPSSFWSNFERMDGYVTLVHVFLYFVVLGSVLTTKKLWDYFLHTSLSVAFFVTLFGLAQYGGMIETYRGNRIDSWLGNPAYLAIYLFFHTFIAGWLMVEAKTTQRRLMYALLGALFIFALLQTGTRGTVIGMGVGLLASAGYIGVFGARFKEFRSYAIGAFAILLLSVGALFIAKDTAYVQESISLSRIANIDLGRDLEIRTRIWGLAREGVEERPLLGYGQSNFNYVFNEYYDPALYGQEQWFDRVHNIFFDWLVTGGVLGLIAYLSIFAACAWYLFVRPLLREDETFTVLERGILVGILAGYFTHNFVVFDNIVSYIFFAVVLALIHSRVATPIKGMADWQIDRTLVTQIIAPAAVVIGAVVIYVAHVPGMLVAGDIIDAFRAQNPADQIAAFERALGRESFAKQEIIEQFAQRAMSVSADPNVPDEVKQEYLAKAEAALKDLIAYKPDDARVHVFFGSYYRTVGNLAGAAEQMAIARALSPLKQSIITQQGFIALSGGNNETGRDFFKEAFELDTRNLTAREYYAASLFYTGQADEAIALMDSDVTKERFALSDFVVSSANRAEANEFLVELFKTRVQVERDVPQHWATLAYLYYKINDNDSALATLEEAKGVIPTFAPTAQCLSDNIKNGRSPEEGC